PPPPIFTLFPYTTLFRSVLLVHPARLAEDRALRGAEVAQLGRDLRHDLSVKFGAVHALVESLNAQHDDDHEERPDDADRDDVQRSEEHTSELQSRRDLVC